MRVNSLPAVPVIPAFRAARDGMGLGGLAMVVAMAAALALGGCSGDPNEEAAECPKPYLLPDAASLSRYNGHGTDLADLVLNVRLTDVRGACVGKLGVRQEGAHAHVVMVVNRGPASRGNEVDIPYGIGVVLNGQIKDEHDYVQSVVFPPNVNTVQATGQEVNFLFPTAKTVTGPSYHIYFFLKLSPEELEANRRKAQG